MGDKPCPFHVPVAFGFNIKISTSLSQGDHSVALTGELRFVLTWRYPIAVAAWIHNSSGFSEPRGLRCWYVYETNLVDVFGIASLARFAIA